MATRPRRSRRSRPLNAAVAHGSRAEAKYRKRALAPGVAPSPGEDLRYRGGRLLDDLTFTNFYLGGSGAWKPSDIASIDGALAAALRDRGLENVMCQYFRTRPRCRFSPSHVLPGTLEGRFSNADATATIQHLHAMGALAGYDLASTVFDLMLPSGIVLTDGSTPGHVRNARASRRYTRAEESDSLNGLGGYHGSVPIGSRSIYYAVGAYSEVLPGGRENGIVAFGQPWKNVVATFYHELNEARTDPDVDAADRGGPASLLGWVSKDGNEVGDYPIFEARSLSLVFQEVARADGKGKVPVQLMYSNGVHGPEGPRGTAYPPFAGSAAAR